MNGSKKCPREVISIHCGQAGVQLGNSVWELFGMEHDITPNGIKEKDNNPGTNDSFNTFYNETDTGRCVPRAVFLDLEPTVIDEIKTGTYKELFNNDFLISGKEDAANNFARGHYTVAPDIMEASLNGIRQILETCDSPQGFTVYHSLGGGTGSGFTAALAEEMTANGMTNKKTNLQLAIYPSPKQASAVVEPYNAILNTHTSIEHFQVSFMFDNQGVYRALTKHLYHPDPTFININRLVAQIVSSITASLRFDGALNVDLNEFQTNLVPYPRIHFIEASFAPLIPLIKAGHEPCSTDHITQGLFKPDNHFCSYDPNVGFGKLMACALLYRGDVVPKDTNAAIAKVKANKKIQFVDWCPTGFKVGINYQPATTFKDGDLAPMIRSLCMINNNTGTVELFKNLNDSFDKLIANRAFVHHYVGEGMEEGEFAEAREDLAALANDYDEVSADWVDGAESDDEEQDY